MSKIWYGMSYNAIEQVGVSSKSFQGADVLLKIYFLNVSSHLDKIRIIGPPRQAAGQL